jgi:hypothetical protein
MRREEKRRENVRNETVREKCVKVQFLMIFGEKNNYFDMDMSKKMDQERLSKKIKLDTYWKKEKWEIKT